MNENVDHPLHYCKEGKKECIEEMCDITAHENVVSFCLLNSYKYLYRAGMKTDNSKEQDLAKAKWYLDYADGLIASDTSNLLAGKLALYTYVRGKIYGKS